MTAVCAHVGVLMCIVSFGLVLWHWRSNHLLTPLQHVRTVSHAALFKSGDEDTGGEESEWDSGILQQISLQTVWIKKKKKTLHNLTNYNLWFSISLCCSISHVLLLASAHPHLLPPYLAPSGVKNSPEEIWLAQQRTTLWQKSHTHTCTNTQHTTLLWQIEVQEIG